MQVNELGQLWIQCTTALREQVSESAWRTWLEALVPTSLTNQSLTLSAPSTVVKERVETRYLPLLEEAVAMTAGKHLAVTIDLADPSSAGAGLFDDPVVLPSGFEQQDAGQDLHTLTPAARSRKVVNGTHPGLRTRTTLDPRYTFDAFIVGASNRFAHAASLAVAESPGHSYNPLFIHGGVGLGKTHLLHAIGNYIQEISAGSQVEYASMETLLNDFVDAIRTKTTLDFKRRYRECDVLLVDDVQFMESNTGKFHEEFFYTFNALHGAARQIVLTSDRPPRSFSTIEDRLRSRFMAGLLIDVKPPELETRLAILRMKADNAAIPDDALEFIAKNVTDNIRELEGALIRVRAFASLNHQPVDLSLVEHVLSDIVTSHQERRVTPRLILEQTAAEFGFTIDEICGPSRRRPLVTARQIAMYVFKDLTQYSYPAIAREFGGRDHTTVIHAVKKIQELMGQKRQIYDQVTNLIIRIKRSA